MRKALLLLIMMVVLGVTGYSQTLPIAQRPVPDCIKFFALDVAGNVEMNNQPASISPQLTMGGCDSWEVNYYSVGFSAISFQLEGAPGIAATAANDGSAGTYAEWSLAGGTVTTAAQPSTDTNYSTITATGFIPWVRVRLLSKTGTGVVRGSIYGWITNPTGASSGGGGGGGGAVTVANGADVTQGFKADAKSTATDTTAVSIMQVLKEISFMEQNPASRAVTNAGTFAVQCTTGCAAATTDTDDASIAGGQSVSLMGGLTMVYDGTVWRRLTTSAAGSGLSSGLLTIQGNSSGTPIPATVASATTPVMSMNSASAGAGVNAALACVFDDSSPTTPTENNFGFWRCSSRREGYMQLRDAAGNERGANVDSSNRLNTAPTLISGSVLSGAFAVGAGVDGWDVTLGAKGDAKSTATDSTAITLMQVAKQISASVQTIAALAATDDCAGTIPTPKYYISVGTSEDESQVKATAGTLCAISARNAHASTNAFLKCTNLTAANTTPGSSTIFYEMMVPFGLGYVDNHIDLPFDTALTCYIVTGKAASDDTEVAADDVSYVLRYR